MYLELIFFNLFTVASHTSVHMVRGAFLNLYHFLHEGRGLAFIDGLPQACFIDYNDTLQDFPTDSYIFRTKWSATCETFLDAFQRYGFKGSKRSISSKRKMKRKEQDESAAEEVVLPFPNTNMEYVMVFFILSLRSGKCQMNHWDQFNMIMFFIRMLFEEQLSQQTRDLARLCFAEIIRYFDNREWRRIKAKEIALRIAGCDNVGIFDSPRAWLMIARQLPKTKRGTELISFLCIYILTHRIDPPEEKMELMFPIKLDLAVDIVSNVISRAEARANEAVANMKQGSNIASDGSLSLNDHFERLALQVAFIDMALQAFIDEIDPMKCIKMVDTLNAIADAKKTTMNTKYHEVKYLITMMERTYGINDAKKQSQNLSDQEE